MVRSWNYRVVRRRYTIRIRESETEEIVLGVYEVHYSGDSPVAVSQQPTTIVADTPEELVAVLVKMMGATEKPILDYEDFAKVCEDSVFGPE